MTEENDGNDISLDALSSIKAPTEDEIAQAMQEAEERREAKRAYGDTYATGVQITADRQPKRFNMISLRDWLHVVRQAGLDAVVPADHVMDVDPMLPARLLDEQVGEEDLAAMRTLSTRLGEAMARYDDRVVVRWDLCASGGTKSVMGTGDRS